MDIQNLDKKSKKDLIIIIKMLQKMINLRTKQNKETIDYHIKEMRKAGEQCDKAFREIFRGFRG